MSETGRVATAVSLAAVTVAFELWAGPRRLDALLPVVLVALAFVALAAFAGSKGEDVLALAVACSWLIVEVVPSGVFWHRAVLAHLVVHAAWRGRLSRAAWIVVLASYLLALGWPTLPSDMAAAVVGAVWCAALIAVTALAPRGRRRSAALVAAWLAGTAVTLAAVLRLVAGPRAAPLLELGYDLLLIGAAAALAVGVRSVPLDRLIDAVVRVGEPSQEVRDELARLVGEPQLRIASWDPGGGHTVPVDAATGRRVDQAVRSAVAIQQEQLRLAEDARRRIAEAERARRLVVVADAAERARFARDLRASVTDPLSDVMKSLHNERARNLVGVALDALHSLAVGLAPAELDGGLPAAIGQLANRSPLRVTTAIGVIPATDPATTACVYFTCAEALANAARHGSPGSASVSLRTSGESVELTVRNPSGESRGSPGTGLAGLATRAETLGGSLRTSHRNGLFVLELRLPAASVSRSS